MNRDRRIKAGVVMCKFLMWVGVCAAFFAIFKNSFPHRPAVWAIVAISGFATIIESLLEEEVTELSIFTGVAGSWLVIYSLSNLPR